MWMTPEMKKLRGIVGEDVCRQLPAYIRVITVDADPFCLVHFTVSLSG
jgi:hypothetical protein